MTPREKKLHDVLILDAAGRQRSATVVERDRQVFLWDGLNTAGLALPERWNHADLEAAIMLATKAKRVVVT